MSKKAENHDSDNAETLNFIVAELKTLRAQVDSLQQQVQSMPTKIASSVETSNQRLMVDVSSHKINNGTNLAAIQKTLEELKQTQQLSGTKSRTKSADTQVKAQIVSKASNTAAEPAPKKFPSNKVIWCKDRFVNDADFRAVLYDIILKHNNKSVLGDNNTAELLDKHILEVKDNKNNTYEGGKLYMWKTYIQPCANAAKDINELYKNAKAKHEKGA